ncbi:MAG: hypothetical protein QG616_2047 [Pseudomonadota bacterium]|nr:hypothetical protein [Pseudomonadota bacterium]MDQ5918572.1 hypothetical protein [Pseudomonadota bacterium]MDQ5944788.1 hypothetical protein [Pseudomonadota bacterium]
MKKLSMLVAAVFAFVSFGAFAVPKAAETANDQVASASVSGAQPKAAAQSKNKSTKKSTKPAKTK